MNTAASYHERLDSCESLRGIAISLVFFYHFLGSLRGYAPNPHANAMTALAPRARAMIASLMGFQVSGLVVE